MDPRQVGLAIVTLGVVLIAGGALIAAGLLGWFGRLPGDFRYESENVRFYAPIASTLLISLVLTVLLAIGRRFF